MSNHLYCSTLDTQIGILGIAVNERKELVCIDFLPDNFSPEDYATKLNKHYSTAVQISDEHCTEVVDQLNRYFEGSLTEYTLPLHLEGTEFQITVWRTLAKVPYGATVSYGELAVMAGYPGASRAVGTAMKHNPIPLVIPCHRVIKAGKIAGNFGGGRITKKTLLTLEGVTDVQFDLCD